MLIEIGQGRSNPIETLRPRGENLRTVHDLFGKDFTGFDAGGALRRSKYFELRFAKLIDNTQRQRGFRSNDRQIDLLRLYNCFQPGNIVGFDRHTGRERFDPCIARRTIECRLSGTLRKLPHHGVLASPTANNQNVHGYLYHMKKKRLLKMVSRKAAGSLVTEAYASVR